MPNFNKILPVNLYKLNNNTSLTMNMLTCLIMDGTASLNANVANLYNYAGLVGLTHPDIGTVASSGVGIGGRYYLGKTNRWLSVTTDNRSFFNTSTLTGITFAFIRRKIDLTLRSQYTIGTTSDSARCGFHLPWSDGNVYWDFGGTGGGSGRLTWTGYSPSTNVEMWVLHAGSAGREIWLNGTLRQSAPSDTTTWAIPAGSSMRINNIAGDINSGDDQEFYQFLIISRQWNTAEIKSWFNNPWQIVTPLRTQPLRYAAVSPPPPPPPAVLEYSQNRLPLLGVS